MKAILIVDIDDKLVKKYKDFTIDYDLRGKSKNDGYGTSIDYVEDCPLTPLSMIMVGTSICREYDTVYDD